MVATAAWCSRALATGRYDLALNVGVCGSYDATLPPGTVVHVVMDRLAELGAENGDEFLTIEDLQLLKQHALNGYVMSNPTPPISGALMTLPGVCAITSNTAHGREESIEFVRARFGPQVESMEGAAFMYACLINEVPFAQVRAVSNVVEKRNREAWRMDEAIRNLGSSALKILDTLPTDPSRLTSRP